MSKFVKTCNCCGAKMVTYRHTLNKGLVSALVKLSKEPNSTGKISKLKGITHNQIANFQKLRYWGLVSKVKDTGKWSVTLRGKKFVANELIIFDKAYSYRGQVAERLEDFIPKCVCIYDFIELEYETREDYNKNATNKTGVSDRLLPNFK